MSQNEPKMDICDPFSYFGMPFQKRFLIISVVQSTLKSNGKLKMANLVITKRLF